MQRRLRAAFRQRVPVPAAGQQAVETLDGLFEGVETVDRKIVVTCPHCFNTLGREYRQLGANYTVLHHTQLLNRLVRDKKLVRSSRSTATAADRRSPTTTRVTWADTTSLRSAA
ncbi:putative IRON-SULFUR-BINDING REDUCTASE domain protein [Mycobacterium xenopi 3993]|nr:putative IRON-SULFUR-BINDING REDUCTASE domain protein [Mycobacterium xenopi 3993]